MATHKVRVTIQPDVEREVGDAEYADLKAMGLLLESNATTEDGLRKAAVRQVVETTEKEK